MTRVRNRLMLLAVLVVWFAYGCAPEKPASVPSIAGSITFGETNEFWTAPTILAQLDGRYQDAGIEVTVAKFPSGLAAKNALVSGSVDVALAATTPVAIAAFAQEPVRVIGTYMESEAVVKILMKSSSATSDIAALRNQRIGYIAGTISELVLDRMVAKFGWDRRQLRTASFRPPEVLPALGRSEIDAAIVWEPFGIFAVRDLPGVTAIDDPTNYKVSLHLLTRPDVIDTKPDLLRRFLLAINQAATRLTEDPTGTRRQIEQALTFKTDELSGVWPRLRFGLWLTPEPLVRELEAEGTWALRAGHAKGPLPNYSGLIERRIFDAATKPK